MLVVSVVVRESGKNEDEVMFMRLKRVFAYMHCWYVKRGVKCNVPGADGGSSELADILNGLE